MTDPAEGPIRNHVAFKMNIYVASSWRNERQPEVVEHLRGAGFDVYDFRNPTEGDRGFHWSEIDPQWQSWDARTFRAKLKHPVAQNGYAKDHAAMFKADACVLVLPAGRSAHLEAGFIGRRALSIALLSDGEPELMYNLFDHLCLTVQEVVWRLGQYSTRTKP